MAGVIVAVCLGMSAAAPRTPRPPGMDLKAIQSAGLKIAAVHQKKSPVLPGDWLERQPEHGQSFDEYRQARRQAPLEGRPTIYLQPIGMFSDTQQRIITEAGKLLGIFYGLPVEARARVPLDAIPSSARRRNPAQGQEQLLTTFFFKTLLPPLRPAGAAGLLGFTATDLWPGEGWNFVFGQGSPETRVGIYSLARYGKPESGQDEHRLCLRRTLKVAVHEMGHMLGIAHCTTNECGMNGANSLAELDRNRLAFCPECEQKIWWSCRFAPQKRYEALVQYARRLQWVEDEMLWQESLDCFDTPTRSR